MPEPAERMLAAIMFTDIVGYTAQMQESEEKGLRLRRRHREVLKPLVERYHGDWIQDVGDESLSCFPSALDAVNCALAIQETVRDDPDLQVRIGVHLGDVVFEEESVHGDGVNVAARIRPLADPGGICVSGDVRKLVRNQRNITASAVGEHRVKNVADPVSVFAITGTPGAPATPRSPQAPAVSRRRRIGARVLFVTGAAFMLVAGVVLWPSTQTTLLVGDPVLALPSGPSVAVLPFVNMSNDPAQDYFSDGLTEDIITGLSRFRELAVMARNSSFQYKGKAVDVKKVGRDLGVRYVVEGSVRRDLETIRVTAQLLDTTTGAHLWAETYDRDLSASNIFAVQDEITEQVVGTIADTYGIISRVGREESKEKRTENLEAYDCVLRAYAYFQLHTPDAHLQARDCLERAVNIEPGYVDAWAHLAYISREEHHHGFNARPGSLDRAVKFARHAIELDSTNQMAHLSLSMAYYSHHQRDPFLAEAERAIALNPNNGRVLGSFGQMMSFAGEWERGVALSRKAVALNPYHPGWFHLTLSSDHYRKGEYEQALAEAQRINRPSLLIMHASLAAIYGQLGRHAEAQAALADLRELDPNFPENTLDHLRKNYFSEELVESFMDGLRKAGQRE